MERSEMKFHAVKTARYAVYCQSCGFGQAPSPSAESGKNAQCGGWDGKTIIEIQADQMPVCVCGEVLTPAATAPSS